MDFNLDDEQQMLQDSCRRLLEQECAFESRAPLIAAGSFDLQRWKTFAEMGWLAINVPEERGGLGNGPVESCILMEEIGRVLCVEPLWAIGVVSAQLLVALGASTLGDDMLEGLMAGSLRPVLAHGEPSSRGDAAHVSTVARPIGPGRWAINGEKSLVVGGNAADTLIVSARTSGAVGEREGISLFRIRPDAPGLTRRDVRLVDNRWAVHLVLDGAEVDESDLLGPLGGACAAIDLALGHGALALCAEAVGLMDRALYITRDYLKLRQQFGVPLASFQAVQHRMSEMLIELELARSMVYRGLSRLGAEASVRNAALSSTKIHVGRSGRFVCGQAIQLSGGIGITEEYVIGHYFKRMTAIENALGSSAVHLERLATLERAERTPVLSS